MENLTTPKAILLGLGLIALAIASVPYSSMLVKEAHANSIQRVQVCGKNFAGDWDCVGVAESVGNQFGALRTEK